MKVSIRKLRNSMKTILSSVQHGKEVVIYLRKRPIAKIISIQCKSEEKEDCGFGMWSDYVATQDVKSYIRKIRKGRKHDM